MVGITQTWPQLLNEFTPGNSGLCVDVGGGLVGEQHRLFGSDEDLESSGRFYYVYATADAAAKAYAKGIAGLSTLRTGPPDEVHDFGDGHDRRRLNLESHVDVRSDKLLLCSPPRPRRGMGRLYLGP